MSESPQPFSDPQAVARYAEGPPRLVPGFADLLRMSRLLLAERAPSEARVLILGAGGGLEMTAFAQAQPGWMFDGVDPSAEMLQLAAKTLGPHAARAHLHHGYIDAAPAGPFDAATCLLTLHFVPPDEKLGTLVHVHRRLAPGAPFVMAHLSFADAHNPQEPWLSRYAAFAVDSGNATARAEGMRAAIGSKLHILAPEQDEALLREAGFSGVGLFYAGFAFRGWVAYA